MQADLIQPGVRVKFICATAVFLVGETGMVTYRRKGLLAGHEDFGLQTNFSLNPFNLDVSAYAASLRIDNANARPQTKPGRHVMLDALAASISEDEIIYLMACIRRRRF